MRSNAWVARAAVVSGMLLGAQAGSLAAQRISFSSQHRRLRSDDRAGESREW